jgi:hypothetical protein
MANGTNPFALLTDAQFAALFAQAALPVFAQSQVCSSGITQMMNGQMTPTTLNPQVLQFQSLYNGLAPYFSELAARAAAGT